MELENLYVFLYKICSLSFGMLTIYLGYRLFVIGIHESAGDFTAKGGAPDGLNGDSSHKQIFEITLKNAAPGTFFALFGMLVIGFTVYKGLSYSKNFLPHRAYDPVEIVVPNPIGKNSNPN